jgi:MFS family permease
MKKYLFFIIRNYLKTYSGFSKNINTRILISLMNNICGGIIFYLSFYFVKILHFNITDAGLIISCYGLGTIFGGYFGGKLSDNFSPKLVSVIALFIESIAILTLLKNKVFSLLLLNLFIYGIGTYLYKVSNYVYLIQQCPQNKKLRMINILYMVSNFGIGIAAAIVSIMESFGFNYIFALFGSLLFIIAIALSKEKIINAKVSNDAINTKEPTTHPAKYIVAIVLMSLFFVGLIISQRSTTYSLFIHHRFPHLGIHGISFLFALNPIIIVLFQNHLVKLFEKYNKLIVIGIGAFFMGSSMFVLNFSYFYIAAVIACVTYTIGEMLFFSMAQFVCYEKSDANKKGMGLGLFQMIYASSVFIGPTLGGNIYDRFGGEIVWCFCGLLGLISLLFCFIANINLLSTRILRIKSEPRASASVRRR